MRNIFLAPKLFYKRAFLFLVTLVLVVSPFSYLFRTTVQASNSWTKRTDSEFADANNAIVSMVQIGEDVYFYTNGSSPLNVYKYDGQSVTMISSSFYDDPDNGYISGLVALGGKLLVLIQDGAGNKIMMYENGEWHTTYDKFPLPAGEIKGMGVYQGNLIVWLNNDEPGYLFGLLFGSDGGSLGSIMAGADNSFGNSDLDHMDVVQTYSSGDQLYVIGHLFDNDFGDTYYVYKYDSGITWTLLGSPFTDFIDDMAYFDGSLYIITSNWEDQLQALTYDGSDWQTTTIGEDIPTDNIAGKFIPYGDEFLAIATVRYNGAQILAYWDGVWQEMTSFIGEPFPDAGEEAWSSSIIPYYGGFLIAISSMGEGPYNAELWEFNVYNPYDDTDIDGVINRDEDMAPNAGDANNDGQLDKEEPSVTPVFNTISNNYNVLATDCFNSDVDIIDSATLPEDKGFDYPAGIMAFNLDCTYTETDTAHIVQYYYGDYDPTLVVVRKYNTNTHTYQTISDAVVGTEVIDGRNVLTVTYSVTDGGPLDEDGEVNGMIVDPVGIAMNSAIVPNTGLGGGYRSI